MNEEVKKHIKALTDALRQQDIDAAQQAFARTLNAKRKEYRNELAQQQKQSND